MSQGEITQARLKLARRLLDRKFRASAGEFLVEGAQATREAVAADAALRVLATPTAAREYPDIVAQGYERLTPDQVKQLTDTVTPQGIFAICRAPNDSVRAVVADDAQLVVICAQIRDPGNVGTVIRCADAFGASGVILTKGSVDVTNPKAVRASVGSIFHLKVASGVEFSEAIRQVKAAGFHVLAADADGEDMNALAESGFLSGKIAWIMGNEAWGLPDEEKAQADKIVQIPMYGKAESLNLGAATAVCLYATASAQHHS